LDRITDIDQQRHYRSKHSAQIATRAVELYPRCKWLHDAFDADQVKSSPFFKTTELLSTKFDQQCLSRRPRGKDCDEEKGSSRAPLFCDIGLSFARGVSLRVQDPHFILPGGSILSVIVDDHFQHESFAGEDLSDLVQEVARVVFQVVFAVFASLVGLMLGLVSSTMPD
jgi:hypothetical protein